MNNSDQKKLELFTIEEHKMHLFRTGDVNKPKLVFMSGSGTAAPMYDFKILYEKLIEDFRIKPFTKYENMKNFFAYDALKSDTESSLYELLNKYIMELNTYKEADLCESSTIKEKLFVSTVHKAKGLEFENVIVMSVNDGIYPYFFNCDYEYKIKEDARKLYVAMSRAREKLVISYAARRRGYSKWGNKYDREIDPSRFMRKINVFFEKIYL